jgi:Xaa-Pro aminopeptidase
MPVFSREEMQRRIAKVRAKMAAAEIDCLIATSYAGFYYLTGVPIHWFGRPLAAIIPLAGEPAIVESIIELEHTRANTWIDDLRAYHDYNIEPNYADPHSPLESMVTLTQSVIAERKLTGGRLGFEGANIPVQHYEMLAAALPDAEFVDTSRLMAEARLVLSDEELALTRAADQIADLGQAALIEAITPGKSAHEIEHPIQQMLIDKLMDLHPDKPFNLHIISGLGSGDKSAGHSEWKTWNRSDVVKPGQLLESMVDVWLWGYWGNVERAVAVGEPDAAMRKPFEVMVEANEAAIAAVKPGATLADVDRAAKAVLTKHGYQTRAGTGCGRGITSYEGNARELLMDLRLYANIVLEPSMAFSIEPDVREPGIGTFRHCNTIIVTDDGCEVDSTVPRGVVWTA